MQLLYSKAAPSPEFVSLSLLMKDDMEGNELTGRTREPLLIPSPVSTVSQATGLEAIKELHLYVLSIFRSTAASKEESRRVATALFREDEKLLEDVQVYRPANGQGVGLHFKLFRDRSSMLPLIQLVLKSTKTGINTATKGIENEVVGVLMTLGMSGLPLAFPASSLHYSLSQRMKDCIEIVKKTGVEDLDWSACLLATLLLTEEESRLSNMMATGADYHLFIEGDDTGRGGLLSGKRKHQDATMDLDFENPLSVKSADQARIMVERLAVLSVAENDTIFKKYQGKAAEKGKSRRRKTGREADLDGFDFRGDKRSSREIVATPSAEAPSIKSLSSKLQLKKPKNDTARIGGGKNRTPSSVPALSASNRDTGGSRSRRSSLENTKRHNLAAINRRGGADSNGNAFSKQRHFVSGQGTGKFDPFAGNSIGTSSTTSETTASSRRAGGGPFETPEKSMDAGFRNEAFGRDLSYGDTRAAPLSGDAPRMQVNVALNEDLTCFYRLSKMSSCTVEGVIQVQVKSNVEEGTPFFMAIRDPSGHIQSLQENKKFAEDRADAIEQHPSNHRPDYKFALSVPKGDEYFPVMKYKCGSELRPVPIRVQTRVRLENPHWRVALQISSNPHNQDNLTDLTIIMGVPPVVRGETLITSPPGGVWNASKRSVIWCVSELGGGEKFQLQARFEIEADTEVSSEDTPKFPVLVRCQCMYAQLSDVQVDVRDVPEVCPADVRMKLARRFRLSHRERP